MVITLTQDAHAKLSVSMEENRIIAELKKFFNWRKASMERFSKLGTTDYDNFIKHLHSI